MGIVSVIVLVVIDSAFTGAVILIRVKNRILSRPNTVATPLRLISLSSEIILLLKCSGAIKPQKSATNDNTHKIVNSLVSAFSLWNKK